MLDGIKITYIHIPTPDGLCRMNKNSINLGWRNTSFRRYTDYIQAPEFYIELKELN